MTTLSVVVLVVSTVMCVTSWTLYFLTRRNVMRLRQALRDERAANPHNDHVHITFRRKSDHSGHNRGWPPPTDLVDLPPGGPFIDSKTAAEIASRLWPAGPDAPPPPAVPPAPPPPASGGRPVDVRPDPMLHAHTLGGYEKNCPACGRRS